MKNGESKMANVDNEECVKWLLKMEDAKRAKRFQKKLKMAKFNDVMFGQVKSIS